MGVQTRRLVTPLGAILPFRISRTSLSLPPVATLFGSPVKCFADRVFRMPESERFPSTCIGKGKGKGGEGRGREGRGREGIGGRGRGREQKKEN